MKSTLWQKTNTKMDPNIQAFLAGKDVELDNYLFLFDIEATLAHAKGLEFIKILTPKELNSIQSSLRCLRDAFLAKTFILNNQFEDGHSAIEFYLTEELGDLGKKIHTGRSRNDQVLVATRLYLKAGLDTLKQYIQSTIESLKNRIEMDGESPMPGYTHLQRAVPTDIKTWIGSYLEAFEDNLKLIDGTRNWIDKNPLGSVAGYGVSLNLNKELTTKELGFASFHKNPLAAQNSRGKYELQVLQCFSQCMLDLRRLAWDLSLYSSQEFNFIDFEPQYCTGSSIMPNKHNPDVVELMRGSFSAIQGAMAEVTGLLSLPAGYHRDLQLTKQPTIRAIEHGLKTFQLLPGLISSVQFKKEQMAAAISPEMEMTEKALAMVKQGVSWRDAYRKISKG